MVTGYELNIICLTPHPPFPSHLKQITDEQKLNETSHKGYVEFSKYSWYVIAWKLLHPAFMVLVDEQFCLELLN